MDDKLYRPIMKDDHHLVRSTKNPERFRGQSRDSNNKNPDIIEWEEVDLSDYEPIAYEDRQVQLTDEEIRLAQIAGEALSSGTVWLLGNVVAPWWKERAWPWIKIKCKYVSCFVDALFNPNTELIIDSVKVKPVEEQTNDTQSMPIENVSEKIEEAFESLQFNMNEEEAKKHILNIIFHLLEIANEIRIMSNAQIQHDCETSEQYLERVKVSETFLTNLVADKINKLLSDETLSIDVKTSKQLFGILGGGVKLNGEYVPVETSQVYDAILAQDEEWNKLYRNQ